MRSEIYLIKNNNNIFGIYIDYESCIDYIFSCIQLKFINANDNITIYVYKPNSSIIIKEIKVNINSLIIDKLLYNYNKELINEEIINDEINKKLNKNLNDIFKLDDKTDNFNNFISDSSRIDSDKSSSKSDNSSDYESDTESDSESSTYKKMIIKKKNDIAQEKINLNHSLNLLKREKEKLENDINTYDTDLELYYKFKSKILIDKQFIIPILFENKFNIFKQLEEQNQISFDNFTLLYNNEVIPSDYDGIFNNTDNEYENKFINSSVEDITKALVQT
jgi:hypothetical protein